MGNRVIKFIRHGIFTAAQLTARNPYLDVGELIYERGSNTLARRCKVGPGRWNDLPYFQDNIFTTTGIPTNPIGDADEDISDQDLKTIIQKMLFPALPPVISAVQNNAGGQYGNQRVIELGTSLSGTILVAYNISNPGSLSGSNPILVDAGGIFSSEGAKPNSSPISLTLSTPLNPSTITTYTINLRAVHTRGTTDPVNSTISFLPRIIWGVSPLTSFTGSDIVNLSQKQSVLSSGYKRDYQFNAPGYCVIAVPVMFGITNPVFSDVTNPNAPGAFSMEDLGTLTVNNGVGSYLYQIYRSSFYITAPSSTLRIA